MNNFYGFLPTIIRHDKNVSDFACRLYSELASLSNKFGYSFATNDYLADVFDKTPEHISRVISSMQKAGYLSVVIEDGYKRKIYVKTSFEDLDGVDKKIKGDKREDQGGLIKRSRGVDKKIILEDDNQRMIIQNHNQKEIVETSSTPFLSENEIEDIEQQIYASKATQKPKEKVAPKRKGATDNPTPTPIKAMWEIYELQYAKMCGSEKPEFMPKYLQPMKKLYGILEARQIQSGIVPLDKLQPWKDFVEMWGKYLQDHPKETYFTANFNPATFYSQFNTIVAKLKNQPMTTEDKWEKFYRENTTG